jgi:nucleotide sugar dehydrogenase
MDISIVGSGYVGTTVAACFADLGHTVTTIDIDDSIVAAIEEGDTPIHEPGLDELVAEHGGDRLRATTAYDIVPETDLTMLALPTPSQDDGSIDLQYMKAGAESVGEALKNNNSGQPDPHLIVTKSTVIPTTTDEQLAPAIARSGLDRTQDFLVASNPEFQREGSAVIDFLNPHKLVFGTADERALELLHELYEPLHEQADDDISIVETDVAAAEMIKYGNNAFLASKVSLINDLGNVCKEFDVDTYEVANAIGLDDRIGARFLRSGVGFGGSCFPKDTNAIIAAAEKRGYTPPMLNAALNVNDTQPERLLELLKKHTTITDHRIAVLGLAFKPGTDDIRHTRAAPVIDRLCDHGADVVAYDPVAMTNMREQYPEITYVETAADALADAYGAVVVTGWDEFAALDTEFDTMTNSVVIDGRRIVNRRDGITYEGLTW